MSRLIILLRGINVSGHNKVPMAELRSALTNDGFENVSTYIQSGNIALDTDDPPDDVTARIAALLVEHFDVEVPVVSIDQSDIDAVERAAPFDPDGNPAYQLIYFPGDPVDVSGFDDFDHDRFAGDKITPTANAVYVSYGQGQSKTKLTLNHLEKAAGTNLTGRNLRTVAKLSQM